MAEQNFYNILHAFLQMLTTSFLHVEYRKLATYLTTLEDIYRAVARSENLGGGHIVLGGDNVPPLVEIGLTDPPKSGRTRAPPRPPTLLHACSANKC